MIEPDWLCPRIDDIQLALAEVLPVLDGRPLTGDLVNVRATLLRVIEEDLEHLRAHAAALRCWAYQRSVEADSANYLLAEMRARG